MNSGSSPLRKKVIYLRPKDARFSILIKGILFLMIPKSSLEITIYLHWERNRSHFLKQGNNEGGVRMVVEKVVESLSSLCGGRLQLLK